MSEAMKADARIRTMTLEVGFDYLASIFGEHPRVERTDVGYRVWSAPVEVFQVDIDVPIEQCRTWLIRFNPADPHNMSYVVNLLELLNSSTLAATAETVRTSMDLPSPSEVVRAEWRDKMDERTERLWVEKAVTGDGSRPARFARVRWWVLFFHEESIYIVDHRTARVDGTIHMRAKEL